MCYMTTMLIPHPQPGSTACLEFYNPPNNASKKNMALLETLKPSTKEEHKPSSFHSFTTPPTITTNNSPSGALILEIIFSDSDSTGTAGPANSLDEESDAEEDESDDDVSDSDESEEDSGDQHYQGDSDEEEEEEDDEDDDEDNNSEEDNSDDEDYDEEDNNEDFGTPFDDDLIIDFSNGDEDDEEDGLLVEFEEHVETTIPPPSKSPAKPPKLALPFWFTHEEQDQIHMIFESYALTMDIEEQRKQCIRSPAPFVGRVVRTPLKPASDTDTSFKTLDKVEVYLRELYPLGTNLPLSRTAWVLTTWDVSEGVPTHAVELSKSSKKSMQKQMQTGQSSTLYCAPVFMTKEDYQYTVSPTEHSLMYASSSSTNTSISRISPFIPAHCRNISFSLD